MTARLVRWWRGFARLFVIKTKFEAFMLIYAIAVGAVERGMTYLHRFPGSPGWIMFTACTIVVFMAGGKILDGVARDATD
ncbi:hypothetical protein ASE95_00705 [Sphingomonas sp. Leaf231]|uniref:hypothetical protein n=1 Tax=Sphingomonas sp. Leaf231 TaxID=1736301 RepID=UPI0006FC2057|nr:hypothetical protein [Sphingomonas sp. Leaf231]KQN93510.1 hypothetical protein ASE95_00705 [Sphingomonas sp. Leaf231]